MADDSVKITRLASRAPGTDPESPYTGIDISELPDWWQRAIREFQMHDLRPYRPPQFADREPTYELIEELEDELTIEISFGSVHTDYRAHWELRIDGKIADTIDRRRSPEGFTVYEIESEQFEELVREFVANDRSE